MILTPALKLCFSSSKLKSTLIYDILFLQFLEKCGNKLSEHSPVRECVDVKFFIIIISLIEELEVKQKRLVQRNDTIAGRGSDMTNELEHRVLNEKFGKSLLLVLVTCFSLNCN